MSDPLQSDIPACLFPFDNMDSALLSVVQWSQCDSQDTCPDNCT